MLSNVVNILVIMGLLAVEIILPEVIWTSNFEDLTNMISESNNNNLYIAGKSSLKMLNVNLTLLKEIKTLEDDYNKILLVGGSENRLIACGTSSNTTCFIRDLNNLEILNFSKKNDSLILSSERRNVVAVIGQENKDIMFVGNYFDKNFIEKAAFSVHPLFYNGIFALSLEDFDFYDCNDGEIFPKFCSSMPIGTTRTNEFDYIDGFVVQGFVYMFKTENVNNIQRSVVARVCENDRNYFNSYFEMPIKCDGLTKITAVTLLVADEKLSSRINSRTNEFIFMAAYEVPGSSSTRLCPIRVPIISEKFSLNKKRCFDTTGLFLLPSFNGCLKDIPIDFCGGNTNSQRSAVMSQENIEVNALIEVNFTITSLLGYNGENSSILFIGASNGYVVKMDLTSQNFGMKYLYQGSNSPAKNLILSRNSQYLFWRTANQVFRSDVTDCNLFHTCDKCLDPLNPLCGWCSLESRCTRRLECFHHDLERRWIPSYGNSSHCPMLIKDFDLELTMNTSIKIEMQNPPQLGNDESLECVFSTWNRSTPAFVNGGWISCDVPTNLLSSDGIYEGQFILRIYEKNSYFLTNNFFAYRCSFMNTCDSCLSKKMCYFDIVSYSCTTSPSGKTCPSIMNKFLRFSTGTTETIEIQLENVQGLQLDNLMCWISGLNVSLPITKSGSNGLCGPYKFGTLKDQEYLIIYVTFGANKRLNGSITIEVYNCEIIGKDDCSLCKSRGPKYECVWCGRNCNFRNCSSNSKEEQCPFPSITEVGPLIGPKEGGTRLSVCGKNLGSAADQVVVKIDDKPCKPLNEFYIPSRKYVCLTPASNRANVSAKIALQVTGTGENNSIADFLYKEVKVAKFYPLVGPQAGGTKITLTGENLVMDPRTSVNITTSKNERLEINRNESNSSQIVFTTLRGQSGTFVELTNLTIDGYTNNSLNQIFKYLSDPYVNKSDALAVFKSAGCNLTIFGSNLNFSSSSFITTADCSSGINKSTTIFQNFEKIQAMLPRFDCPEINATLHLDGWTQNMIIKMIEEPKFSIQNQENSLFMVAISGNDSLFSFHQSASSISLVSKLYPNLVTRIELKNEGASCTRLRALDNNIICEFVTNPGDYVQLSLCDLSYKLSLRKQNDFPAWQTALGVCIGILLVVLVIVCATLLIKYFESKRNYKKLMMEINVMEKEARNQMKEAFAKLQTTEGGSQSEADEEVPFNPYRIYSYRILYPRERDDHVLHTKKRMEKYEKKNQCLTQLLNSKFFFVNFVKVLEKQKDSNEKSKIGSYLSLFLLDKMDYAAQVITALLSDRIDSFLSSGKNLKLMMRSGETVVERIMSSWLSLTMYRHLTGNIGRSLLELCVAIKKQAYSGPVDVCTNEARFTLSEGFFLKNYKFEESEIVVATFENSENHPSSCKLLACDAICQAKEKIYDKYFQGVPFRLRLPVNKFNLVWRRGPEDLVTLHEEDDNNDLSMEVVKVKTLRSYGVTSGSHFILERRLAEADESQVQLLGDETLALYNGSPSLYPITVKMPQRRYHLVDKAALENKAIKGKIFFTEMYYPLLQTKVALEDNINKLFTEILNVSDSLPPSVKFLFDFIDDSIQTKGINEQDIAKLWKRDSFMLRVWVNLIQNPYFLLDIPRNPVVDVNLAVIGQALVDSCSPQEKKLTKDSPTSTLLFAKNHKDYRPLVRDFYENIQNQPRLPEARFMKIMESTYSRDVNFNVDFNLEMVLAELYEFAKSFKEEILVALDDDESSRNLRLVQKFQFLFNIE